MDAATYNRSRFGIGYTLADLPSEWAGTRLLVSFDTDGDVQLSDSELSAVDWTKLSGLVRDFQQSQHFGTADVDGKLGPGTLAALRAFHPSTPKILLRIGDLELPAPEDRLAPPGGQPLDESGSPDRAVVARLWNNYGGAVKEEATKAQIDPAVALAIFSVESKQAYDPTTGLVIARFEPTVFLRRSGRLVTSDHKGQLSEWQAIEAAYAINPKAAIESASYGLPQLMGFNCGVAGQPDARSLLLSFQKSARAQVAGFFGFVTANHLSDEARERRFVDFARRYNGIGKEQLYADKMARYYGVAKEMLG
jgi:hypothetical protein